METFWPGITANWGRWGHGDERGTLNLAGPDRVRAAAATVRSGRALSLARPFRTGTPAYYPQAGDTAFEHRMITWWGSNARRGRAGGQRPGQLRVPRPGDHPHGRAQPHRPPGPRLRRPGVRRDGRARRGRRLRHHLRRAGRDPGRPRRRPRLHGVDHLPAGTAVGYDDLAAAAPGLEPGDALLVRTGRWSAPAPPEEGDRYGRLSGLHPDALRFVQERDAAVVGTDGPGDAFPVPVAECRLPVHVLALVYLGVHLVHSMALDELAEALAAEDRTACMLTLAPLAVPGGTGSPITPVAVL